jgi:hypothetical protein
VELQDDDVDRGAILSTAAGPRGLTPAELVARQETYKGFGDTLAVSVELAVSPVIFGLVGYGLDRWLGIVPVLTIVLVLLCIAGLSVRMWFDYDARMKVHEAAGPWARTKSSATRVEDGV